MSPADPPTLWVSAAGDATDRTTWSGIPAHLIEGAQAAGLPFAGLSLLRPSNRARGWWNLRQLLLTGRYGGFQFSRVFLDALWRKQSTATAGGTLLSCYQLLPDELIDMPSTRRWFYIDGTLTQLFAMPDNGWSIPPRTAAAAIAHERRGYQASAGVICHSGWAAASVVGDYGMPPERVHVVLPGGNLDAVAYARWRDTAVPSAGNGPLRLIFIGRYPQRKGLDRLLAALPIARTAGAALTLTVIGCTAADVAPALAATPGVEWLGDVDKRAESDRFLSIVASAEVGCLLSRAEFGGMVQREYAALGLVALGPDVHGAAEHAGPGAVLVGPDEPPPAIAGRLIELASRGDTYRRLRAAAWGGRDVASWPVAARALWSIINR